MKLNVKRSFFTHEGAKATQVNYYQRLKRTVLACMLFEDNFYENGVKAVDRIKELCEHCFVDEILLLALTASLKYNLRHVPLQLLVEAIKKRDSTGLISIPDTIEKICKRPDQLTDLLSLYWKDGKKPLAHKLKKGLAKAFANYDEYQLSKYDRDGAIKLRDVLFLCHAKPKDAEQEDLWKRLINKQLNIADTWETRLSSGQDKKESFKELLFKSKMGKLAILRNLRNMYELGIEKLSVSYELMRNQKEMLPFQYIAAARECPQWEDIIDAPMIASSTLKPKIYGKTFVLVDVSGSMFDQLSSKSKMTRMDAACGLAILLRECLDDCEFYSFSNALIPIPARHGFALRDALVNSQVHSGTYLGSCLNHIIASKKPYDRIIVITDEQISDFIPKMPYGKNYILNIAGYQNGIGSTNEWNTITGFSESSIDFIRELEAENACS